MKSSLHFSLVHLQALFLVYCGVNKTVRGRLCTQHNTYLTFLLLRIGRIETLSIAHVTQIAMEILATKKQRTIVGQPLVIYTLHVMKLLDLA